MAPNPLLRLGLDTGPLRVALVAPTPAAAGALAGRVGVRSDIVVCEAEDAQVILMDASASPPDALEAIERLSVPVVVLSADADFRQVAVNRGARGAIDPGAESSGLIAALIAAVNGLTVIDAPPAAEPPHLTRRENQVLDLVARGFSNRDIAALLDISEHTVKFHVGGILGKLGAATRAEAVAIAARERILP